MRATIHSCFALCAATLAIAAPCVAQRSVEFASFGGIYIPTARAIQVSGYCPGDSRGEVRQRGASVVGARVTAWTSEQLGFDLSLGYSKSGVTGGLVATDESGTVDIVTGSARVLVGLTPRTSPTSFALAAGLARSEEHTSELQSRPHLVCRLLLEKKKKDDPRSPTHLSTPHVTAAPHPELPF